MLVFIFLYLRPANLISLYFVVSSVSTVFFIFLSLDNGYDLSKGDDDYTRLMLYNTGWVDWMPFLKFVTSCTLDLTYFPVDRQTCFIVLLNDMYTSAKVNITLLPNSYNICVDTSDYCKSSGWDLVETSCSYDYSFPFVQLILLHFVLQRVSTYFIINIVIPTICLSILSIMVFWVPPEAGEKMGLSVTVLMSYSVILVIMSDNIPQGNSIPIISNNHTYYFI